MFEVVGDSVCALDLCAEAAELLASISLLGSHKIAQKKTKTMSIEH
jgi:hypothetical protein